MIDVSQIREAVSAGIRTLNEQLPNGKRLADEDATALGALDSLDMVTLIVAVDERLRALSGTLPSLASEESFFSRGSRPATVRDLGAQIYDIVRRAEKQ